MSLWAHSDHFSLHSPQLMRCPSMLQGIPFTSQCYSWLKTPSALINAWNVFSHNTELENAYWKLEMKFYIILESICTHSVFKSLNSVYVVKITQSRIFTSICFVMAIWTNTRANCDLTLFFPPQSVFLSVHHKQ